jgi:GNAT superfamily N-acetyltransferase
MSDWYRRLTEYFPEKEMKSRQHFDLLFQEKAGSYQLKEGSDYVLVYFEQADFIFVDYILVTKERRGEGRGSVILDLLKEMGKAIILEVEPANRFDPDSEKRLRFYEHNDFLVMDSIQYERIHMVTNELNIMDVYCWAPLHINEQWAYDKMKAVYEEVHAYKSRELYGCHPQPVSDVLKMRELTYIKAL